MTGRAFSGARRRLVLLAFAAGFLAPARAQVVTTAPAIPAASDAITITFHADRGEAGLAGQTGDIYIHTGVITDLSTRQDGCQANEADWRHVKTAWGQNTPETLMTRTAPDTYTLTITDVASYYAVPASEEVLRLAMVFRNASGSLTGKDTGGCDIFVDLLQGDISARFVSPAVSDLNPLVVTEPTTVDLLAVSTANTGAVDRMTLFIDNVEAASVENDTLAFSLVLDAPGRSVVRVEAHQGAGVAADSFAALFVAPNVEESLPPGVVDGITYGDDPTRATLSVYAPFKEFVHVIGDFSDWDVRPEFQMKRHAVRDDSVHFWIELDGLEPGREYGFQYLMDGALRLADPYTEKVLSPEDSFIPESIYPGLKPYPAGRTQHAVGVLETAKTPFTWTVNDFVRPPQEELVIYELLVRDFLADHDWLGLIDTLGYLDRLGVNAIELMPHNEFEGNESWGYNPSFYFAVDKFYGPSDDLKRFIDAAHDRGMAVIMDMVLQHSFGQAPLVRQYFGAGQPTAENPWFNAACAHPATCFGFDFDHESPETRAFVDRVNAFWLEEFRFDGFRFDFTQGFTNNNRGGNFDADRIAILERMAQKVWEVDPAAYVILEHWTADLEQRTLANQGMMVWTNVTHQFQEAAMGFTSNSDFSDIWSGSRGWAFDHIVGYMESHDEERIMFKNLAFGNGAAGYSVRDLPVALDRVKALAAFLYAVPGPRMLWMFGELGYDVSIDFNGRTGNKPIRWDYYDDPLRRNVYEAFASIIHLRRAHEVFHDEETSVTRSFSGDVKRVVLSHPNGERAVVIGNFGVVPREATLTFPQAGTWRDFFSGTALEVAEPPSQTLALGPGEFHIYTSFEPAVVPPEGVITVATDSGAPELPVRVALGGVWPNPLRGRGQVEVALPRAMDVTLTLHAVDGRLVWRADAGALAAGRHDVDLDVTGVAAGTYFLRVAAGGETDVRALTVLR